MDQDQQKGGAERILVCDIGNTAIKIGIASAAGLAAAYTLPSRRDTTADSLGLELVAILRHAGLPADAIKVCAAASVCPALNGPMAGAVRRYLHCPCLFVPEDVPVPLENLYKRPGEVGADRLVAAWAARKVFPDAKALIVVDFGTAVTFDCVEGSAYLGGLIFPGVATAMTALAANAAKLPLVSLELDDTVLRPGRDTVTSMRHGLAFGYAALAEGLCGRLREQLAKPAAIVATGGHAAAIGKITSVFDKVIPGLMLEGLSQLYFDTRAPAASRQQKQRS